MTDVLKWIEGEFKYTEHYNGCESEHIFCAARKEIKQLRAQLKGRGHDTTCDGPSLPSQVKVGGFTHTIEDWDPREAESRDHFGECQRNRKLIRVDCSYGDRQSAKTLLHEILHVIYSEWSIKDSDDEEAVVDSMSNGLHAVYRDNPELMRWIADRLGGEK